MVSKAYIYKIFLSQQMRNEPNNSIDIYENSIIIH